MPTRAGRKRARIRAGHSWSAITNQRLAGVQHQLPLPMPEMTTGKFRRFPHIRPQAATPGSASVWRRKRSNFEKFVTSKVAAARALSQNLELRSKIETVAKNIRDLQLRTRTKQFADDFRVAVKPRLQRLAQTIGPEIRHRAAGVAESLRPHATPVRRWLSQHFGEEMYGKTFVASAAMTTLLYLIAREMKPSESWQHPGRLIVAFATMLWCALSVGLGVAILF